MRIKLAIFDLDGTLVDSAYDITNAANYAISKYGQAPIEAERIKSHIGAGLTAFIRGITGEHYGNMEIMQDIFVRFNEHYSTDLVKHTRFYPGAVEFLHDFTDRSKHVGVVTNKAESQAKIILDELTKDFKKSAKDLFVDIFGSTTFKVKKPHPLPLIEMMKKANVKPSETVMVGDSRADLEAARAAGTHFVGVSFGFNPKNILRSYGSDHIVDHFDELHSVISKL